MSEKSPSKVVLKSLKLEYPGKPDWRATLDPTLCFHVDRNLLELLQDYIQEFPEPEHVALESSSLNVAVHLVRRADLLVYLIAA